MHVILTLVLALVLAAAAACGDNTGAGTFDDLVPDPAVASGCLGEPVASALSRAKVIECADEVPRGFLAAGQIGDVVIENSQIEIVIRASGEGYVFPGTGAGGIIDVAHVGGTDRVKEMLPLAELASVHATEVVITEAGDSGPATVVVRGHVEPIPLLVAAVGIARPPVMIETTYTLPADSSTLTISSRLLADRGEEANPQLGDLFFFSSRVRAWLPRIGFAESVSSGEFLASSGPDISYGLVYPSSQSSIQFLVITGVTGILGPSVETKSSRPTDLMERFLVVGDGSISSITDRAWEIRGVAVGTLSGTSEPNVEIVARDALDLQITRARTDDAGEYEMTLPPGDYTLTAESPERNLADATSITMAEGLKIEADVLAGARGTLSVSVTEEGAAGIPARIVVLSETERRIHFADASGTAEIILPAERWTVQISRGVEYTAFTATELAVFPDQATIVEAVLERVVDTDGWISLDPHLHSEMSVDSSVPLDERVRSVAAEGVEIAISSDHDFVSDYKPLIDELGLAAFLNHSSGVETSTFNIGHFNAWPIARDTSRAAGGAFAWYDQPPGEIFASMRARNEAAVIQVNHPRNSGSGFFNSIDFNRELGMATQDPAALGFPGADFNDFNFDAIEIGNDFNDAEFPDAFADFLALVNAGHPAAATGSSDSHGLGAFAGNSRTYIFVGAGADDPATVDLNDVHDAIRARKVVVSQGAFVTAQLEIPNSTDLTPFGGVAALAGETTARLKIHVQAPPWMPLKSVVVYHGRDIATTLLLDSAATQTVRFDGAINLPITAVDGFFLVLVEPAGRGDPVLGQPDASFTNPILYDADGNGRWNSQH